MELFGQALGLGTIGLVAGVLGAVIAALATRGQTSTLTSYVQHFAAGLIIAAATLDLLPEALGLGGGWPLIIGFVLGTAFMLALRTLLSRFGHGHSHGNAQEHGHGDSQTKVATDVNLRLVVALAVVVLIDGAIIGIALSAGGAAALSRSRCRSSSCSSPRPRRDPRALAAAPSASRSVSAPSLRS